MVIALPFFSLRLGSADQGNDPVGSTTRQAYDMLAKGFGPGFNGPLELVAVVHDAADDGRARPGGDRRQRPARCGPGGAARS